LFTLVANVIMLNMLIAQMGNSFNQCSEIAIPQSLLDQTKSLISFERIFKRFTTRRTGIRYLHVVAPRDGEFWSANGKGTEQVQDLQYEEKKEEKKGLQQVPEGPDYHHRFQTSRSELDDIRKEQNKNFKIMQSELDDIRHIMRGELDGVRIERTKNSETTSLRLDDIEKLLQQLLSQSRSRESGQQEDKALRKPEISIPSSDGTDVSDTDT
jgi:hypothetical protein